MNSFVSDTQIRSRRSGFTLVEMLVVIAIMSILMTAGAIGLGGMGGKGVTSGVATAESLFDEARATAIGQRTKSRVLVAVDLTNNPSDNLRKILIMYAELDPVTGNPKSPESWVLSSRGAILPDQTYFSQIYSMKNHQNKTPLGASDEMQLAAGTYKSGFVGKYSFYEFNAEGICTTPGASFIIGAGARKANPGPTDKPQVTSAGKRDFGGFVVWRNGRTSVFKSPDQMNIPNGTTVF